MPEDAEAIAQITRESYEHLPSDHVPYNMGAFDPNLNREQMEDPSTRWAVLLDGARRTGVAMWRLLPGMSHLHMLFVSGNDQRKGFGRLLLRHHQDQVKAEQPDTRLYTLHCLRDSYWAIRFYKHQGYTIYEPGDEWRITDLVIWIDACRRHDNGWPLKANKVLMYKRAH